MVLASRDRTTFDDRRRPLHHASCNILEVSQYSRVYIRILAKNGGLPSNLNANLALTSIQCFLMDS